VTTAAIETTALTKRYGSTWALRDCSLALPAERIAALVGPNGAGKTTLLHLAVGLLEPTAGSIRTLGASPRERADILARVGFVAQDAPLYAGFTVRDTLEFGRHLNPRWDDDLAIERMRRHDIDLRQRVGTLSGGQRAQVALTLAVAKRPELLVLDEPLASLDPLARREFMASLMEATAESDLTVLLSSHLVTDMERICDYLIVLSQSRVQVLGEVPVVSSRCSFSEGGFAVIPARFAGIQGHRTTAGVCSSAATNSSGSTEGRYPTFVRSAHSHSRQLVLS